jgi:hypothetical protein
MITVLLVTWKWLLPLVFRQPRGGQSKNRIIIITRELSAVCTAAAHGLFAYRLPFVHMRVRMYCYYRRRRATVIVTWNRTKNKTRKRHCSSVRMRDATRTLS